MTGELYGRIVTGALIGVVIIGATLLGQVTTSLLILAIISGSAYEFFRMQLSERTYRELYVSTGLVVLPLVVIAFQLCLPKLIGVSMTTMLFAISLACLLGICLILQLQSDAGTIAERLYKMATALLLFTIPGAVALLLCNESSRLVLMIFVLLWSSDVFAYFGGRKFGKRKLAPHISPGKTWEGFVFGLVATVAISIAGSFLFDEMSRTEWVLIGLIVVVFGTLGDLLQSVVKRSVGLKDSGRLLPGHGGMWDRFDSFIGCLPWIGLLYFLS